MLAVSTMSSRDARAASDRESIRGFVEVEGQLGLTSGALARDQWAVAPGWQVELGAGPRKLPFMVGLGMGVLALGPLGGGQSWSGAASTGGYDLDLRHLELAVRLEPAWRIVRPFADASVGFAALYLTGNDGGGAFEQQEDIAPLRAFALGVDVDLSTRKTDKGTQILALTLGVRAIQTGFLRPDDPGLPMGETRLVSPFLAITGTGWL